MLNISIRKVDFNELNIENISKRPILDTLEKFYKGSESEYYEFLEQNGLSYFKSFSTMRELQEVMDNDVAILNTIAEQNLSDKFDYKTINFFKSKNLKPIQEHEFYKLTIDLRQINDESQKEHIKDLFLETKSSSLVDFMEVNGDYCSLIYHKKGAFYYNNEPFMNNTRPEQLTIIENYTLPKDNNFIMGRFLFDLACKLDDNNIEESFCIKYSNGEQNIKNIQEIIYWGHLNSEEKKEQKELIQTQIETQTQALDLAKTELKAEAQASRDSLKQEQSQKILEDDKSTRLYTIAHIPKSQENNLNKTEQQQSNQASDETDIEKIVAKSIEIYRQKELEKTKIRLEKAEKDSAMAYNDLKDYLNNGLSILEAIKNIQQKYRNEDTINFASLLFSKDILNLSKKEQEIITLNNGMEALKTECENAYNEIDKREETISKLKSTLQKKLNEMQNYEYELQKEFESKLQEKEAKMIEKLETFEAQQQNAISEYESEINELDNLNLELSNENKALQQSTLELKAKNASLEQMLEQNKAMLSENKEALKNNTENVNKLNILNMELKNQNAMLERNLESSKKELEHISKEFKSKLEEIESHTKKMYKLEAQAEIFDEKEKDYKEQIAELKQKNATLESKLNNILDSMLNKNQAPRDSQDSQAEKPKKNIRSRDILGD